MRSPVRSLIAVMLVALALTIPLGAQQTRAPVDPATTATIRRLLDLTGAAQLALRGMEAMIPAQREASPQVPAVFWDAFLERARREISHLVDEMVPIYAAHFTPAQLTELVRFYESPLGRHVAEVQPLVTQESIQAGQRWGGAIGRAVAESLSEAGVKFPTQ
jgi:uncharacterized protein